MLRRKVLVENLSMPHGPVAARHVKPQRSVMSADRQRMRWRHVNNGIVTLPRACLACRLLRREAAALGVFTFPYGHMQVSKRTSVIKMLSTCVYRQCRECRGMHVHLTLVTYYVKRFVPAVCYRQREFVGCPSVNSRYLPMAHIVIYKISPLVNVNHKTQREIQVPLRELFSIFSESSWSCSTVTVLNQPSDSESAIAAFDNNMSLTYISKVVLPNFHF